ncbi:DUF4259 domain-containing protein [Spirillospora sp. NPDC048819]|uniref:DUF4259 domain-containing protein n=1 Tax=Spirillospora sp. NPDC048819 TaxID=3155268 RepID=UPI0033D39B1E
MGTWGPGPFDNDHAADFADDLDETEADQRADVIRQALSAVAGHGQTTSRAADPGIAAAALVAAQQPGGAPTDSVYGPEEPIPPLPHDLVALAADVLDRVVAPDSEVKELWAETADDHPWHDEIAKLRAALTKDG